MTIAYSGRDTQLMVMYIIVLAIGLLGTSVCALILMRQRKIVSRGREKEE